MIYAVRRPAALLLVAHVQSHPRLRLSDGVETHGEALFAAIAMQDFEASLGRDSTRHTRPAASHHGGRSITRTTPGRRRCL